MRFMTSDFETRDIEFGDVVRGILINRKRPLNVYIKPSEIANLVKTHKLTDKQVQEYLNCLKYTLQPGGRIEIKYYEQQ